MTAIAVGGLLIFGASEVRADYCVAHDSHRVSLDWDVTPDSDCAASDEEKTKKFDAEAFLSGLQADWQALREEMTRSILEATLTAFFIRGGSPPPPPNTNGTPPPTDGGPPPPPPPPPAGGGETPPVDPPVDPPPPQGAPEPTGLVIGLLGAGLASLAAWRRRKTIRA